jgi:hypothetical protein
VDACVGELSYPSLRKPFVKGAGAGPLLGIVEGVLTASTEVGDRVSFPAADREMGVRTRNFWFIVSAYMVERLRRERSSSTVIRLYGGSRR